MLQRRNIKIHLPTQFTVTYIVVPHEYSLSLKKILCVLSDVSGALAGGGNEMPNISFS